MVPPDGGLLSVMTIPAALPEWLREADIDFCASEFARTGFRGGLNWYRNIDRNSELPAPFAGAKVTVPALYIAGDRDVVVAFRGMDQVIANLANDVPRLPGKIMLPSCGHWTQQERASEVNAAMIDFLRQLYGAASAAKKRTLRLAASSGPQSCSIPTAPQTHQPIP
jgi:pimeloyl-ACP methyl ester carboxylesterase